MQREGRQIVAKPSDRSRVDGSLTEALRLHNAGQSAAAIRHLNDILAREPEHAEALFLLGHIRAVAGRNGEAIALIRRSLRGRPDDIGRHLLLARLLLSAGKSGEARAVLQRAAALAPDSAAVYQTLGLVHLQGGETDAALKHFQRAVALAPADAASLAGLGLALARRGSKRSAKRHLQAALDINPRLADASMALARILIREGRPAEALGRLKAASAEAANNAAVATLMGQCHLDLGDPTNAAKQFRRAIKHAPRNLDARLGLVIAFRQRSHYEKALAQARDAVRLAPRSANAHLMLGHCFASVGNFTEAEVAFKKALSLRADFALAHCGIAECRKSLGEFEVAIDHYRRALALDPRTVTAYYGLSKIKDFRPDEAYIGALVGLLDDARLNDNERCRLDFAAARALDDLDRPDEAFAHYRRANEIRRRQTRHDPAAFSHYVDTLIETFSAAFFAARPNTGSPSRRPVFVVGMPRSGSTLIEGLLANHPDIFGAGEPAHIATIAAGLDNGSPNTYARSVAAADPAIFATLAQDYLTRLKASDRLARRVVDKALANYRHLGLIQLMFPAAAIIHCRRDPMDTCLSCYQQLFTHEHFWTYDLESLGLMYRDYRRLMDHWHAVLPAEILDVDYEGLVADREAAIRRIVDFIGLDWDDRCLSPSAAERAVRTASFWQVRQPIYRYAVGRWRRYAKHLAPLAAALGDLAPADGPIPAAPAGATRRGR